MIDAAIGELQKSDLEFQVREEGSGPPLLVLPGVFGLEPDAKELGALVQYGTVITPTHPGFGGSPRPSWCDSVTDLAFGYWDWVVSQGLTDVTLIGCSFGGWVAMEIAVQRPAWLRRLVLVDSLGLRIGPRDERVVADVFALTLDEIRELAFADPVTADRHLGTDGRSIEEIVTIADNQEGAAVYGWQPYMHNPKLPRRLGRIDVPTLVVWGENDQVINVNQGSALAALIPTARLAVVEGAGHHPHLERPEEFATVVGSFIDETKARTDQR